MAKVAKSTIVRRIWDIHVCFLFSSTTSPFRVCVSEKTNMFVALLSQSKEYVVANQLMLPKIFCHCFCVCVHRAPQNNLLDPSPINETWNFYYYCCGFSSKFLYHNETIAFETWDSLFRWQQRHGIDEFSQTIIIIVMRVPYTFGALTTQNILKNIKMSYLGTKTWGFLWKDED